jgi:acetoin utilization deacetylase AcuC-like enzyme
VVSPDTYRIALLSAGGVLQAIDAVMKKEVENAFCAIRPPGHHAEKSYGKGFCIFNNVAIGAKYIQQKYNLPKVLIVDWDVHHGNGTQNSFYNDPSVYFFSVHQYPFYPGTGAELEEGEEEGFGYTMNVPMVAGSGDVEYLEVFENFFYPVAEKFAPDFILISAGFDAHKDDPLAEIELDEETFQRITQVVVDLAEKCCEGRLVSVLEGGYDLKALATSVEAHLWALMGKAKIKRKKE